MLYMMAILLCLSSGSCKRDVAPEDRKDNLEVTNGMNDNLKEGADTLNDTTTDSKTKVGVIKKKDVILHKTKAQYVIY